MKKMIGIFMMVIGGVLLVGGYIVYANKEDVLTKEGIEAQIQAVIADGVFTNREKEHIGNLADKHGMSRTDVFADINARLAANAADAETEIIDQAKKKGDDFEKFIVKKFNQKYFTIKQWAGDKYVDGIYSEKTTQPDLIIEFAKGDYTKTVAIECKWRSDFVKGEIKFSYDDQLARYKKFESEKHIDVYVCIGVGGKASAPEHLYLIPLSEVNTIRITKDELGQYPNHPDSYMFLNMKTGTLSLRYRK